MVRSTRRQGARQARVCTRPFRVSRRTVYDVFQILDAQPSTFLANDIDLNPRKRDAAFAGAGKRYTQSAHRDSEREDGKQCPTATAGSRRGSTSWSPRRTHPGPAVQTDPE